MSVTKVWSGSYKKGVNVYHLFFVSGAFFASLDSWFPVYESMYDLIAVSGGLTGSDLTPHPKIKTIK